MGKIRPLTVGAEGVELRLRAVKLPHIGLRLHQFFHKLRVYPAALRKLLLLLRLKNLERFARAAFHHQCPCIRVFHIFRLHRTFGGELPVIVQSLLAFSYCYRREHAVAQRTCVQIAAGRTFLHQFAQAPIGIKAFAAVARFFRGAQLCNRFGMIEPQAVVAAEKLRILRHQPLLHGISLQAARGAVKLHHHFVIARLRTELLLQLAQALGEGFRLLVEILLGRADGFIVAKALPVSGNAQFGGGIFVRIHIGQGRAQPADFLLRRLLLQRLIKHHSAHKLMFVARGFGQIFQFIGAVIFRHTAAAHGQRRFRAPLPHQQRNQIRAHFGIATLGIEFLQSGHRFAQRRFALTGMRRPMLALGLDIVCPRRRGTCPCQSQAYGHARKMM